MISQHCHPFVRSYAHRLRESSVLIFVAFFLLCFRSNTSATLKIPTSKHHLCCALLLNIMYEPTLTTLLECLLLIHRYQLLCDQKIRKFLIRLLAAPSRHFNTDSASGMGCANGAVSLIHMLPAEIAGATSFVAFAVILRCYFDLKQA
jgi:hypothetical protein